MGDADFAYRQLLTRLLNEGVSIQARNGPCRRLFAEQVAFDRAPLVSLRRTAWITALREMEWFLSGSNDIGDAHPSVRSWWEPWANEHGILPGHYGGQLRRYGGWLDQVGGALSLLCDDPHSRRNLVTTWNPQEVHLPDCALPPCHGTVIQWFVDPDDTAHLLMYQRSADVMCGVPHNWLQYWALLLWACSRSGRTPGTFTWVGGDVHLYNAHTGLALEVVAAGASCHRRVPDLVYCPASEEFRAEDFFLDGEYVPVVEGRAELIV